MVADLFDCLVLGRRMAQKGGKIPLVKLGNGVQMPQFGLGTFLVSLEGVGRLDGLDSTVFHRLKN